MTKTKEDKRLPSRNMKDHSKQVPPALEIAPMRAIRKTRWAYCSIIDAVGITVFIPETSI